MPTKKMNTSAKHKSKTLPPDPLDTAESEFLELSQRERNIVKSITCRENPVSIQKLNDLLDDKHMPIARKGTILRIALNLEAKWTKPRPNVIYDLNRALSFVSLKMFRESERLQRQSPKPSKWISVSTELPEEHKRVLIAQVNGAVDMGFLVSGFWLYQNGSVLESPVTHWRDFPNHPLGN